MAESYWYHILPTEQPITPCSYQLTRYGLILFYFIFSLKKKTTLKHVLFG